MELFHIYSLFKNSLLQELGLHITGLTFVLNLAPAIVIGLNLCDGISLICKGNTIRIRRRLRTDIDTLRNTGLSVPVSYTHLDVYKRQV